MFALNAAIGFAMQQTHQLVQIKMGRQQGRGVRD
jgi:hypothetical protein